VGQVYYFLNLKKQDVDEDTIQALRTEFTHTYKAYNKLMENDEDLAKIGKYFAQSVSDGAKTELDLMEMSIPVNLIEQVKLKFNEYRDIMK
jgi:hypothetical protein